MTPQEIEAKFAEQFRSAGVLPSGPVSPWPQGREIKKRSYYSRDRKVSATAGQMAKSLLKTTGQAVRKGRVSPEIRKERLEICERCPHFLENSSRCGLCGCYMRAKAWVGGDPDRLCPSQKWLR